MTPDMLLVLGILAGSVVLLVTEWIPMETTALLVLGACALTGLATPAEALAGFSNPAVVTVWAVFILSGGLTRTGVAGIIGRVVLRVAGRRETVLVVVIMTAAGGMSAVMNNVAVAALLMPVVMDIARQTGTPSARLLLPLAYGSLLGGLTTQIGTPPNILVTDALRENGLTPFSLFDFTPIGLAVMAAGIGFTALVGRRWLPDNGIEKTAPRRKSPDLFEQYHLAERTFRLHLPGRSPLVGRSLAEVRLRAALGLNVMAIGRQGKLLLAPHPSMALAAGDDLIVEGRVGSVEDLKDELVHWGSLAVEPDHAPVEALLGDDLAVAEVTLSPGSEMDGETPAHLNFRRRHGVQVLAVRRRGDVHRSRMKDYRLAGGDVLLVLGHGDAVDALGKVPGMERLRRVDLDRLRRVYRLEDRLLSMKVDADGILVGKTLLESRLGELVGASVLGIVRGGRPLHLPEAGERLLEGDRLLIAGRSEDFELLGHLKDLEVRAPDPRELKHLETEDFGLAEAMLSPHTTLAGKSLRQLAFREKYGLSVLAIWREGKIYEAEALAEMPIRLGDALLVFGPREKLAILGREPDFLVLTEAVADPPATSRAKVSVGVMVAVLLPVILGWVPIPIAAVVGSAAMVVTRCLTMEEAYRAIEWKGIFLIAGMMPLGTALDRTGAAGFLAAGVVDLAGGFGPLAVTAGLMALTFLATCVIPTAALVVLMTPIVLRTADSLGASPYAMMMAMAMAASASFMTPISHPANVMVMGPGGYRFRDYLRLGVPLTIVVMATVLLLLPHLWPLYPAP